MTRRNRKLTGTILMLAFVCVYALVVMALAQPILTGASKLVQALFYAIAGLAWIVPLIPLLSWMERKDSV